MPIDKPRLTADDFAPEVLSLFDKYVHGGIDRRGFLDGAAKFAVGGVSAAALLEALSPKFAQAQQVPPTDARLRIERVEFASPQGYGKVYGPYRANNDLLSYHLDIRVDPEKKLHQRQEHDPLQDAQGRHAHPARSVRESRGRQDPARDATPLKYEREINTVFVDFPETLKAGADYSIDFHYSGTPDRDRAGSAASRSRKDPKGRPWIYTACEGQGAASLVAEQGPVARRSRVDGHQRRDPERSSSTSRTARSWARPTSATATRAGTGRCSIRSTTTTCR